MSISEISLNNLLTEILNTKVTIIGDLHDAPNWTHNQEFLVSRLLDKQVLFGLECPMELLSLSPLVNLIPKDRRFPLVTSYEKDDKEFNKDITLFLSVYASLFKNPFVAVLGYDHLDIQHDKLEVPNITINQSFNGTTYPGLKEGVYKLDNLKYLIKGDLSRTFK
ncbi:MAG: hypothetical protein PHF86_11035 [Candidatus Nanoarchaeia archaeon]|nr:hypothetical protein [Candidatus Nanoarchaeia archaeon]